MRYWSVRRSAAWVVPEAEICVRLSCYTVSHVLCAPFWPVSTRSDSDYQIRSDTTGATLHLPVPFARPFANPRHMITMGMSMSGTWAAQT